MIEAKNLRQYYRGKYVLDGMEFKLKNGGVYGVLDADGGCAHVLLALLSGALLPDEGFVRVNGLDTVDDAVAARRTVGYVPASVKPYADMTVEEYMTFIADAKGIDFEISAREVQELLEALELRGKRHTLCAYLSVGEERRLALAQALVGSPEFILLEDPFARLGERDVRDLCDRILGLGECKTVFVSASPDLLSVISDEVMILKEGKLYGVYGVQEEALAEAYATLGFADEEMTASASVRRRRMRRDQRRKEEKEDGAV